MKFNFWSSPEKPQEPAEVEQTVPPPLPIKNAHGELILPQDFFEVKEKTQRQKNSSPLKIQEEDSKEKDEEAFGAFKYGLPL